MSDPTPPKRPDVTVAHKLAHDCVTMTLHGPLPVATSMKLAEHVLALASHIDALETAMKACVADHYVGEGKVVCTKSLEPHLRIFTALLTKGA